jgi:hypothetical protein
VLVNGVLISKVKSRKKEHQYIYVSCLTSGDLIFYRWTVTNPWMYTMDAIVPTINRFDKMKYIFSVHLWFISLFELWLPQDHHPR